MQQINELADKIKTELPIAIDKMNHALASAPKQYQPFFAELNQRLMQAMKNRDMKSINAVQKDIMKFIENERKK